MARRNFGRYVLLAGGLGNIYYQLNQVSKLTEGNFKSCTILYTRWARYFLSHTQPLGKEVQLPEKPWLVTEILLLCIALLDVLNYRIFGRTVLTVLDTTNHKYPRPWVDLIYFGYFQHYNYGELQPKISLSDLFPMPPLDEEGSVYDCIHFRFGDYMQAHSTGARLHTNMPRPTVEWFENAVKVIAGKTGSKTLYVVTDNIEGATAFFSDVRFDKYESVVYQASSLKNDLRRLAGGAGLINFNSTLSLMIFEESASIRYGFFSKYLSSKVMSQSARLRAEFSAEV